MQIWTDPPSSQLTPVPPLAFFSVDPLPSLFAHTVPEIFSLGITRAKETLILTSARQRMVRGEIHYNRVSRFIEDIPKEVLAENETANVQPKEKKERPETKAHAAYRQMRETFKTKAFVQPQVEAKKEGGLSYNVGDRVRHIKFGVGSVTDIREGGRDYEVTVNFDRVGVKKMFASFAKLTKVEG